MDFLDCFMWIYDPSFSSGIISSSFNFLVNLIHKPEKTWLGILILIGIIILFVFIANINRMVEKKILKNREEVEKEEEKNNRKILDTYVEG
jgi:divalent metal cation (Fe/Co/Zn/Cd) transporter